MKSDIERVRKKYLESKQEYFDLLDQFYTQEASHPNKEKSFEPPNISKSCLEYASLQEVDEVTKSIPNEWPNISFDDTLQAVEFFLSIESEHVEELKTQHSKFDKENLFQLIASILFPKFISFFNSSFAPVNSLPLNSIRPEMFLKACFQILSESQSLEDPK